MTITVAFIGQSVGNYMFTVSNAPPVCPANCYMLNRSTLTWGPVTGNGAIEYARRLNQATGQEIRLYNACWDGSAMVSTYAPSGTPNLYWGQTVAGLTSDGPLASFFVQVSAGGYVPNLLELNQGQAEFISMTDPSVWETGAATMYATIAYHFSPTVIPMNVWSGMKWPYAYNSNTVLIAQQGLSVAGAKLGISYYDNSTLDGIHPDAMSHQLNGLRAAVFALNRLGISGYETADNGPRIISVDRWDKYVFLKTSGHPLQVQPWRGLTGFQLWFSDFSALIPIVETRVIDPCTIRLVMSTLAIKPWVAYQHDASQDGSSAVYDTQDCFVQGVGMPLVPCPNIQSAT